jgi:hypothetical protein
MSNVVRDSNWIRREYGEEKWPAVLSAIETFHGSGERFVHTVAQGGLEPAPVRFGPSVLELPRQLAVGGIGGWVAASVAQYAKDSDLIVELGAGWGRNLLMAWLHGANPAARYLAAEFTEAGRQAAAALALRTSGIDMLAVEFDYHSASLGHVESGRRATVFTVHSIEQVPHLDRKVLEVIRAVADEVVVLHFEPVGWQVRGEASSPYAEKHDYNRNLWALLGEYGVDLIEVQADVVGINPDNPTTKIVWT